MGYIQKVDYHVFVIVKILSFWLAFCTHRLFSMFKIFFVLIDGIFYNILDCKYCKNIW
jgi:hypothetical protein